MLVLSRGPQDKVVFPNLGVTVEILRVSGNRVRVGIDAPNNVRVLRHELVGPDDGASHPGQASQQEDSHQFRNQLNSAHLALGLAEKQLNKGMDEQALETLRRAMLVFDKLDAEVAPTKAEPTPSESPRQKRRALLVEDDRNESELLAGFLRLSGFEVETAEDGLQAMVQLGRHDRPDVVLLDMHMPRMNGATTVHSIRSNPEYEGMRLVAVTGESECESEVNVGPDGVDHWFRKPVDPQKLVDSLHETLQ